MNSNLFRFSKRFMAVAAAAAVFASCEKDEFTEKNALDLELQRLRVQDELAAGVRKSQQTHEIRVMQYQRMIDSLTAVDAAGRVYYSVIPYNGTLGVAASGGRVEGLSGAKVTAYVGQYRPKANENTDPGLSGVNPFVVEATSKNGVYAFPAMYSGEVTIEILKDGFSTLNYTANLTPDGPVANGKVVYVGNVVPLFELPTSENPNTSFTKTARVKGKAFVETDLTNGVEEAIPDNASYAVTAQVDTERSGDWFRKRFINEYGDEAQGVTNTNAGSQSTTKSGYIQRFAYEFNDRGAATNPNSFGRTTVKSGEYAMLVPASMSGLPIKLEFDEFAADRTFYRDNLVVSTRHIYGPNVKSDDVAEGVTQPSLVFQAVSDAATATVTFTNRAQSTSIWSGTYIDAMPAASDNKPTIAIDAPASGTSSASVAVENPRNPASNQVTTDNMTGGTTSWTNFMLAAGFTAGLPNTDHNPTVYDFNVTGAGSGYAADPTVTVTYNDVFNQIAFAEQRAGSASTGITSTVRIKNGGYGFIPHGATESTSVGQFTNLLPFVEYLVSGNTLAGSGTLTLPAITPILDHTIGAVSFISVTSAGNGLTAAPDLRFRYVSPGTGEFRVSANRSNPLLVVERSTGNLAFNTLLLDNNFASIATTSLLAGTTGTVTSNTMTFTAGGSRAQYVFVPSGKVAVSTTSGTTYTFTDAVLSGTINTDITSSGLGTVKKFTISSGGNFNSLIDNDGATTTFTTAWKTDIDIAVVLVEPTNTLSAYTTELDGSGLNTYEISNNSHYYTTIKINDVNGSLANAAYYVVTNGGFNSGNVVLNRTNGYSDATRLALIKAHSYLAVVAAPDDASASNKKYAYGVPIYDNGGLSGIRLLYGGNGYKSGTKYQISIIPNFYRGITALTDLPSDYNLRTVVDARASADQTTAYPTKPTFKFTAYRTTTPANIKVKLTNQGKGYVEAPKIVLFDGGLPYKHWETISNSFTSFLRIKSSVGTNGNDQWNGSTGNAGGVGSTTLGAVEFGGSSSTNVRTVSSDRTELTLYEGYFGADLVTDRSRIDASAIKVVFVDGLGETLTKEFWDPAKVNGKININARGEISSISTPNYAAFTPLPHNVPPTLILSAPTATSGGVQATAAIKAAASTLPGANAINGETGLEPVFTNQNGRIGFRIRNIHVTNGGKGYQQGNWYHNSGVASNSSTTGDREKAPYASAAAAAQQFRVIGGIMDGGANFDNSRNETNERFDVYPGNTYVRDIHLGTGHEIE